MKQFSPILLTVQCFIVMDNFRQPKIFGQKLIIGFGCNSFGELKLLPGTQQLISVSLMACFDTVSVFRVHNVNKLQQVDMLSMWMLAGLTI